jgi:flagellar hook-length control protein FliK
MEANGISLGSASVNDGFARQSGQSDQQANQGSGRGGRDGGGIGALGSAGEGGSTVTASMPLRRTVGLVDTFA